MRLLSNICSCGSKPHDVNIMCIFLCYFKIFCIDRFNWLSMDVVVIVFIYDHDVFSSFAKCDLKTSRLIRIKFLTLVVSFKKNIVCLRTMIMWKLI